MKYKMIFKLLAVTLVLNTFSMVSSNVKVCEKIGLIQSVNAIEKQNLEVANGYDFGGYEESSVLETNSLGTVLIFETENDIVFVGAGIESPGIGLIQTFNINKTTGEISWMSGETVGVEGIEIPDISSAVYKTREGKYVVSLTVITSGKRDTKYYDITNYGFLTPATNSSDLELVSDYDAYEKYVVNNYRIDGSTKDDIMYFKIGDIILVKIGRVSTRKSIKGLPKYTYGNTTAFVVASAKDLKYPAQPVKFVVKDGKKTLGLLDWFIDKDVNESDLDVYANQCSDSETQLFDGWNVTFPFTVTDVADKITSKYVTPFSVNFYNRKRQLIETKKVKPNSDITEYASTLEGKAEENDWKFDYWDNNDDVFLDNLSKDTSFTAVCRNVPGYIPGAGVQQKLESPTINISKINPTNRDNVQATIK